MLGPRSDFHAWTAWDALVLGMRPWAGEPHELHEAPAAGAGPGQPWPGARLGILACSLGFLRIPIQS